MVLQHVLPFLAQWTRQSTPDLSGKVAVVSGFNSGLGFETTRSLLEHNAEVIGISRNEELAWQAVEDLQEEFPGAAISYKICNMEVLSEVQSVADELISSGKSISILINIAGRFLDEEFKLSREGIEQTLAVDYYAHVLLSLRLMDTLSSNGPSRIINVSSAAEAAGTIDWDDPCGKELNTSGIKAYGRAKLQLIMFSKELQRRLRLQGAPVDVFSVHPGVACTAMLNKGNFRYPFMVLCYAVQLIMRQGSLQGAQSTIYAATAPELIGQGGAYIGPQYTTNLWHTAKRKPLNPWADDVDGWRKLWDVSRDVLQDVLGKPVPTLPATGAVYT